MRSIAIGALALGLALGLASACGDEVDTASVYPTGTLSAVSDGVADESWLRAGQTELRRGGSGEATISVDKAVLRFILLLDPGIDPIGDPCSSLQQCPEPTLQHSPAAGPLTDDDMAPVLDAVETQGVGASDVVVIRRRSEGFDGAEVYVRVDNLDRLDGIIAAVTGATQSSVRVAQVGDPVIAKLMTEGQCEELRDRARSAALAAARRDAEYAVQGFDVVIGDVISVDEQSSYPPCSVYAFATGEQIDKLPLSAYVPGQASQDRAFSSLMATFALHWRTVRLTPVPTPSTLPP